MQKTWWKEAVAYQIYPRSFMDSNNDGIGDIQGIISKLDYLKELGIDVIWVCPMYKSPNDDNGYDISDYQETMAEFGTMKDFDQLLEEVHKRDMKLILDLVINHTSDEHPWFIESRSSKDNPKRDWYIWSDGKNGKEPNNWESIFNGSAWKWDEETEQYFMHIFSTKQPDLNWENPDVRKEIYQMINWWLEKGIDGFRVDAISHIKKTPGFPDLPNPNQLEYVPSFEGHMNRPGIQTYLEELKNETFSKYDIMTVGEANGVTIEDADQWVGEENGKFNMIFQFEHLGLWDKEDTDGVDVIGLKHTMEKWQKGLHNNGWNALFIENHDQPRSVSSWGDDEVFWEQSAKALGTMYFFMQGTPFIYQGQEIGMTNVRFDNIADYDDVGMKNFYKIEIEKGKDKDEIMQIIWKKGRDNSRTPMQWGNQKNGGFSRADKTWFGVNPNYEWLNVESQKKDTNSIYHYYKKMIEIRKANEGLIYGDFNIELRDNQQIFMYKRCWRDEVYWVVVNMTPNIAEFNFVFPNPADVILSNYTVVEEDSLQPFEARVYKGIQHRE
ncbi:alpha-glucosidase [Bacillus cereus]|uniref:alpha-glucosidase n=1 Tax=Bacillus cereus TaxID=1396 RepID=UPI000B4A5A68|nr:alpha-glucosidase [Bacillus cereus]